MLLRPATREDLDPMVEVMFAEPGVEQLAFTPSLSGARLFARATWQMAGMDEFVVAEDGGDLVGFAWVSEHGVSMRQGARAAITAWGPLGPLRLAAKGWPRQLVEFPTPPGRILVELQTHPSRRGTGVGTTLLRRVLDANGSQQISLTTRTDNPARRLYERHGFAVTGVRTHRAYERRTGAAGRVLMTRPARVGS